MAFDPNKITFFARTDARGKNVPFGIKAKDRQRHMYVIGKTGMGKSTMLENMAIQDMQNGEGMAFIDPHGSAAETILSYVPEHRINDVVYFAPFDTGYPVAFNVMEDVGEDKRHLVVSGLMSTFKKIWVDAWSARMEYILTNTLLALLEYPDSTLLSVNRMLADKDYRKKVVDNVKDPSVKAFWVDEFAKYTDRFAAEATPAIQNKIGQFTGNPLIRNIIGQPKSSFDIRKIMDEKKILIMNLSKGLVGETNANLLGSMLTTRIYLAAMSRADLSPEKMRDMPNFYFYVDEFQSFANATFANILSEARKYHLNLIIAHQYIEQMEEEVRDAVFGNVGTTVVFRVGPFDAEVLETVFTPTFLAADLVNLGFAQIYLTLMIDGIGSPPFSATTLPPIEPPATSCKDMVIASSRKQFSHRRDEVEEQIQKFHEPIVPVKRTSSSTSTGSDEQKKEPAAPSSLPRASVEKKEVQVAQGERLQSTVTEKQEPAEVKTVRTEEPRQRAPERYRERKEEFKGRPERREEQKQQPRSQPRVENHVGKHTQKSKGENLNELRSVLEKIVKTERGKDVSEIGGNRQEEKDQKFKESRGELKSLLTNVLETKAPPAVAETVPSTPMPVVDEKPTHASEQKSEQAEIVAPSEEQAKHTISPKELERMMRVHSSDKPPF